MFMYPGKKLWCYDRYGVRRSPVRFIKNIGNGFVSVEHKGSGQSITVKRSSLRKVPYCERKQWLEC